MLSTRQARSASECRRRSLGVEAKRSRAARAEAARAGRWWPWLDSNGVTLLVQQYDRGTCCYSRPQRQQYEVLLLYKYLVPSTWYVVRVVSMSYERNEMIVLT